MTTDQTLIETAEELLTTNVAAEAGESLLVVADEPKRTIGLAFNRAAGNLGLETGYIEIQPRSQHSVEPPEFVSAAMAAADIVICPTSTSLTHTRARERAASNGARVATMPGITEDMFEGGAITADYNEITRLTEHITERLTEAETARIEAHRETLTMSLIGRDGIASDGMFPDSGASGNLPSGEGYVAPVEGTASGSLVIDGGIVGNDPLDDLIVLNIQEGVIDGIRGDCTETFREMIGSDPCARHVCELGIGTNPAAEIVGTVLEDEKVYGTCHIAFGDNAGFGGTIECPTHVDGIVRKPDVYLDDQLVASSGDLQL